MHLSRRELLVTSGAVLAGAALGCTPGGKAGGPAPAPVPDGAGTPAPTRPKSMSILVLGGTKFLGPDIVEAALARGHTITLFNRGKTNPGLFPDVEKLHGDRDGHLEALVGRRWDAVVDTSGYVPRIVRASAELLAPNVGHYVFISSISAYADPLAPHSDESARVATLTDPTTEKVEEHYGALKAACEAAAEAALPGRVTSIRPGLIVGPGDPSDRFTYWPARVARGGEVLCPGDGTDPAQVIDSRDLGAWIVKVVEDRAMGVYNAAGPATPLTMKTLLETCVAAAGTSPTLTWVPTAFLEAQQVAPWMELPVWTGPETGFATIDAGKAIAAGLTFRPLLDTAKDTLAWWLAEPAERRAKPRAGLDPQKEAAVLAAWKAKK